MIPFVQYPSPVATTTSPYFFHSEIPSMYSLQRSVGDSLMQGTCPHEGNQSPRRSNPSAIPKNHPVCRSLSRRRFCRLGPTHSVLAPLGGGSSRQATFLGSFYEPMPNHLIVVTHTGGSRVKIGSSWRYGFDSEGERKMSCDQNLPSNHYSHWLF